MGWASSNKIALMLLLLTVLLDMLDGSPDQTFILLSGLVRELL
jgi:hypothetical protein